MLHGVAANGRTRGRTARPRARSGGPQPEGRVSSPMDYDHYLERQLMPIASAFTEVLQTDLEALFGRGGQLQLF